MMKMSYKWEIAYKCEVGRQGGTMPLGGLWGTGERIHVAELSLANPGSSNFL